MSLTKSEASAAVESLAGDAPLRLHLVDPAMTPRDKALALVMLATVPLAVMRGRRAFCARFLLRMVLWVMW